VILVTVGAQMPFDRLVRAVDGWAGARGCGGNAGESGGEVFAQIGPTPLRPRHLRWAHFLSPSEFRAKVQRATLLVAHAGMGSILTALEIGRPILVMPRRGDLHETRNDHQVATARRFAEQGRVSVAMDEYELVAHLDRLSTDAASPPAMLEAPTVPRISRFASAELIRAVREFIGNGAGKPALEQRESRPRAPAPARHADGVARAEQTVESMGAHREHV
jgi:UDP-N-acetylglucosamine transferase subunit ALG13